MGHCSMFTWHKHIYSCTFVFYQGVGTRYHHVTYLCTLSRAVHRGALCCFDKAYNQTNIFDSILVLVINHSATPLT